MKCTEEQLMTIEEDAFVAMTAKEIARHIGMPAEEFRNELWDEGSEVHVAYHRGKAAAIRMSKEQVQKQAKIGNPESLKQYLANINDMADDE